jgi:predicted  nucleic acid-binding Zn-ribbon protein
MGQGVLQKGEPFMAFDDIRAQIIDLLERMTNQPHDLHEVEQMVRERLNELRAEGMPLPDDLVDLEQRLDAEFARHKKPPLREG